MRITKKAISLALTIMMLLSMMTIGAVAAPETGKDLAVYFANWSCYSDAHQLQLVTDLPWDKITTVNHAFWAIVPETVDGIKTYPIASTDPVADLGEGGSEVNHFAAYEEMYAQYPNVSIMLSIGGWTKCGFFSEMASTQAGRASFIQSCIDTIVEYPFLAGIDVDWEYPGIARGSGEPGDEGCPASEDDGANYTLLLQEMRNAMNSNGMSNKQITVCAPANPKHIVTTSGHVNQDLGAISQIVNRINIMTYDHTGAYDSVTGHQTNLYSNEGITKYSIEETVSFFISKGVAKSKMNIGSAFYSRGWSNVVADSADDALGKAGFNTDTLYGMLGSGGQNPWFKIRQFEISDGFQTGYDEVAQAAYIYNNNPESKYYQSFYTYDNERSIDAKMDYINDLGLSGVIVWEASGDRIDADYPLLSRMAKSLGIWNGVVPTYTPDTQDTGVLDPVDWPETIYEWFVGMPHIEYKQIVYYKGGLYQCTKEDGTDAWSENWNPTAWEAPNYDRVGSARLWEVGMDHINFNEIVIYDGAMYQCTNVDGTDAWSENWNPTAWEAPNYQKLCNIVMLPVENDKITYVGYWTDDISWNTGDYAIHNGMVYECIAKTHIDGNEIPGGTGTSWGYWSAAKGTEDNLLDYVTPPDWDDLRVWPEGAIVGYNGKYYECIAGTTEGGNQKPGVATANWKEINFAGGENEWPHTIYEWYVGMPHIAFEQIVYFEGGLYQCTNTDGTDAWSYEWNPTAWEAPNYQKIGEARLWEIGMDHINFGDIVIFDGAMYQCTNTDGTDAWSYEWNPTAWEAPNYQKLCNIVMVPVEVDKITYVGYWTDDISWNIGDYAIYEGMVYECIAKTHIDGNEIPGGVGTSWGYWSAAKGLEDNLLDYVTPPDWDDIRVWPVGAIVTYNGQTYVCIADTTIGAAQDPATATGNWKKWPAEAESYTDLVFKTFSDNVLLLPNFPNGVTIYENQKVLLSDNGRTMIPFRFLGEAMGAIVDYDEATSTVIYTLGGTKITLKIDDAFITIEKDGVANKLALPDYEYEPARLYENDNGELRTFVHVRLIIDAFGLNCVYEPVGVNDDGVEIGYIILTDNMTADKAYLDNLKEKAYIVFN